MKKLNIRETVIKYFIVGNSVGIFLVLLYVSYVFFSGGWNPSTSPFNAGIILAVFGFAYPCLSVSLRLMIHSVEMGLESLEIMRNVQKDVSPIMGDVKAVVAEVRHTLSDFRTQGDFKKVSMSLEKLSSILEKADKALDGKSGNVIDSAVRTIKDIRDALLGVYEEKSTG